MTPQLVIALDVPTVADISRTVDTLPAEVAWYKVGLELFAAAGPRSVETIAARGKKVFLDLKLHDIPRTAARAVLAAGRHGVSMLTVHASGGRDMLRAAAAAAAEFGPNAPKLVAVTVLTSLNGNDLADIGVRDPPAGQAFRLAGLALAQGVSGLVCSALEAPRLRAEFGPHPLLVTPGIRPAETDAGDQKRPTTPAAAVIAGADFLVVGRPVLEATDPRAAAEAILREIEDAAQP